MEWVLGTIFIVGMFFGFGFGAAMMAWLSINNYTGEQNANE